MPGCSSAVSGWLSSSQGHHSSSSAGLPRVSVKNSSRSARAATGPSMGAPPREALGEPEAISRSMASRPASAGTSRTSWAMPVAVTKLASGSVRSQWPILSASVLAWVCQAGETGWTAGIGQPIRSQEQPKFAGCAAGATGKPAVAAALTRGSRRRSGSAARAAPEVPSVRRRTHSDNLLLPAIELLPSPPSRSVHGTRLMEDILPLAGNEHPPGGEVFPAGMSRHARSRFCAKSCTEKPDRAHNPRRTFPDRADRPAGTALCTPGTLTTTRSPHCALRHPAGI
ncbi:hypothetical protein SBRY_20680 [Actinacidiphila bryophytorum]|uniref:Uncharacterized protein n=1 Tax=Actinacidiphila bryophytorum TaxID=1436133 RepID=A0A9W4E6H1_9ACTN|nr:hypothetical protein SBRY_20680 [Actinacidiphila bryophytorum]